MPVHICTGTVAIVHKCTIMHKLMCVFFSSNCVKSTTFSILHNYGRADVIALIKKKKRLTKVTKLLFQLQYCTVKYIGCTVSKYCSGIVKNTNGRLKKCNYCRYSAAWHHSYCAKLKQRVKKKDS